MIEPRILSSDPVFQLNTVLWAVLGHPSNSSIQPILRQAGYYLYAIERRVIMPKTPSIVDALAELIDSRDSAYQPIHSDVWLKHETDSADVIIELKSHGFSSTSSKPARQALKMLTAAHDLGPSLGEQKARSGCVTYCTPADDAVELTNTLHGLQLALKDRLVPVSPVGVIGFSNTATGLAFTSPDSSQFPDPLRHMLNEQPVVLTQKDNNDPMPLYFIPWIPGIEDSQHPDLQNHGYNELSARLLVSMINAIGRVRVPLTLTMPADKLLDSATAGTFKYWRHNARELFVKRAANVGFRALRPVGNVKLEQGGRVLTIDIPNSSVKQSILDKLERETPDDSARNLQSDLGGEPQLPLSGSLKKTQS